MSRINSSGSANSSYSVIATIDFGPVTDYHENDSTSVVVSAPWVSSDTILTATFGGPSSDHDVEDAAIENIILSIGNIIPGVSFEVFAHSENFTWGQYQINILGV